MTFIKSRNPLLFVDIVMLLMLGDNLICIVGAKAARIQLFGYRRRVRDGDGGGGGVSMSSGEARFDHHRRSSSAVALDPAGIRGWKSGDRDSKWKLFSLVPHKDFGFNFSDLSFASRFKSA